MNDLRGLANCADGVDTDLYEAAVKNGAKSVMPLLSDTLWPVKLIRRGLVIAVSGFGVMDNDSRKAAVRIAEQGIPVVIATRHVSGFSVPYLRDDPL